MNSQLFTDKNSIWQLGNMRAGSERFVDKAGVTLFSQRDQCHRTHQSLPCNDWPAVTSIKQTNQAEMAATRLAKITPRDPREAPLSP